MQPELQFPRSRGYAQSIPMVNGGRSDGSPSQHGARVLICEDEGIVAADIRMTLRDLGYAVVGTVASAERAVELALSERPDLVLMDIHTKGALDGVAAATLIREQTLIPVVFLTAHADAETVARARAAEPLGYVVKPFKDIDLRSAIEVALQRHDTEQRLREREHMLALETERLSTLIANLSTGVLLEDERGQVRHENAQLAHLLGGAATPFSGHSLESALARIAACCEQPAATAQSLGELARARTRCDAMLLRTVAARCLELCYVPIGHNERNAGALWTFNDVTEREQAREELRQQAERMRELATTDELTGLLNRRGLLSLVPMQRQIARRERRFILAAYIDLDGMKHVNDTLGHGAGDALLRRAAEVLRKTFRASDVVARVGGDEFAVFAMIVMANDVDVMSARLAEQVAQDNRAHEGALPALSLSLGLALADASSNEDIDVLLTRADGAMYEQKRKRHKESGAL